MHHESRRITLGLAFRHESDDDALRVEKTQVAFVSVYDRLAEVGFGQLIKDNRDITASSYDCMNAMLIVLLARESQMVILRQFAVEELHHAVEVGLEPYRVAGCVEPVAAAAQADLEGAGTLDPQERVIWVSPSLQPMTGWQEEQWRGRQFRDLFAAAEGTPEPVELHHWLAQSGPIRQGRLRLADPKGGWSWVQLSVRQLQRDGLRSIDALETLSPDQDDPLGQTMPPLDEGYVLTLQPVDEQVQEERRLLRRASTDALTGLESRATILGWLDQRLLDASGRKAQPLALLFCDFDDFKAINDTHGHACGDVVLKTVAERITRVIRHRDHAGRLGGDEFLVLLDGIHSLDDAQGVAAKLHALLHEPISWGDQLIPVSVSIGVALHGAGEDADLFLKRADRQMYAAKAAGRGRVAAL